MRASDYLLGGTILCAAGAVALALLAATACHAEGWDTESEDLATWFATKVVQSCCDQRDAYLADDFASDPDGNYIAIITDGSANPKYDKPAIPNGTRIVIPKDKIKTSPPAPGHGVVFLSKGDKNGDRTGPPETKNVYCYFPPGGV